MTVQHAPAPASVFAVELLGELIRLGVRDVVVCPGSRSQALALAAAEAERSGAIRLHVRVDERSAAFFALGVARETGVPAPVIVTSGTAAGNLLPAAMEAHEGRVPFLAITADRPAELRGTRSNQTTRQAGLFGAVARLLIDAPAPEFDAEGDLKRGSNEDPSALAAAALSAATGFPGEAPAGPVQLNIAFREPLSGVAGFEQMIARGFEAAAQERDANPPVAASVAADGVRVRATARGYETYLGFPDDEVYTHRGDALAVVIAGADAGAAAEEFARNAGLPLLAEVVSGSRFGREAIAAYASLVDDPDVGALVERAIVFGHPTLTRQVPALLRRDDVETVVVDPHTGAGVDHYDPSGRSRVVRAARVAEDHDAARMRRWLGAWVVADRRLREERSTAHEPDLDAATATGYKERNAYARAEVAALREPVTRELLVESVWRASWPHDRLVVAASRLVRVLDQLAPPRAAAVHANRGLAGIDGTVATALGIAVTSQAHDDPAQAAGTTRVLIGDLALLHDAGSLLLPRQPQDVGSPLSPRRPHDAGSLPLSASDTGAELRPRIQLFVGNDGGGTIFDTLEAAGSAPADAFERVMFTPQRVALRALAEAYGWDYLRVETRGELDRLLTAPVSGPMLIEIPLPRE